MMWAFNAYVCIFKHRQKEWLAWNVLNLKTEITHHIRNIPWYCSNNPNKSSQWNDYDHRISRVKFFRIKYLCPVTTNKNKAICAICRRRHNIHMQSTLLSIHFCLCETFYLRKMTLTSVIRTVYIFWVADTRSFNIKFASIFCFSSNGYFWRVQIYYNRSFYFVCFVWLLCMFNFVCYFLFCFSSLFFVVFFLLLLLLSMFFCSSSLSNWCQWTFQQ